MENRPMITQIKLKLSNAYLIRGKKNILVDTGSPNEHTAIIAALHAQGLQLADISLIVHTHVHSDHVGSTIDLLHQATIPTIPTMVHPDDTALMQQGHNGHLTGIGWRGQIMTRFFNNAPFARFTPDLPAQDELRLDSYGIAGRILHTPGHTPGSISIVLDTGDAIIGDVIMGGYLGGNLSPHTPKQHYFAEDRAAAQHSLQHILSYQPHTLYVGHGGPLAAERVRAAWR
jgi:glyoxylase-like metal-dependent hydrolase (beta-lactamase superfamily II)